ncbi:MAG TPA: MFS transporter [Steroidobacteraceae bacterium]|jgi:predicted MFS family arabinose efflux permease
MAATTPVSSTGSIPRASSGTGYQFVLVGLLAINFGFVFFDRNSLNFLMPFVQPELHLSNAQVGYLASALSLTWAIAAFVIGLVSDKTGSRKGLLILATLCFSVCSFLTGIASSFVLMLGARLLMGAAEGGVMPMSMTLINAEVAPGWRGLAMGVAQNFGSNLLGSFVAPVLLTVFAAHFGWRNAFYLAGLPGLIMALLIWVVVREPPREVVQAQRSSAPKMTMLQALEDRNVLICCVMGVLLVSYLVVCWAFMPLYLTQVRHMDTETESWLMGTLGISAAIGAFATSALSDFIGRKPLMIICPFIAVILPLGALYYQGSTAGLAAIFFVGWCVNGIFPMFMATVPSESVDERHIATALGVCMGAGEVLGGVLAPSIAGKVADHVGLQAPLWIMLGLTIGGGLLAFGLRETAPRVLARRAAAQGLAKPA